MDWLCFIGTGLVCWSLGPVVGSPGRSGGVGQFGGGVSRRCGGGAVGEPRCHQPTSGAPPRPLRPWRRRSPTPRQHTSHSSHHIVVLPACCACSSALPQRRATRGFPQRRSCQTGLSQTPDISLGPHESVGRLHANVRFLLGRSSHEPGPRSVHKATPFPGTNGPPVRTRRTETQYRYPASHRIGSHRSHSTILRQYFKTTPATGPPLHPKSHRPHSSFTSSHKNP